MNFCTLSGTKRPVHVVLAPPSGTKVTCLSSVVYTCLRAALPVHEEHAIRGVVQYVRVRLKSSCLFRSSDSSILN